MSKIHGHETFSEREQRELSELLERESFRSIRFLRGIRVKNGQFFTALIKSANNPYAVGIGPASIPSRSASMIE